MKIIAPDSFLNVEVAVPTSKSISNRLLIIKALSGNEGILDVSIAQDTQTLNSLLSNMDSLMDVGHAGTAFRFLTAYLAIQKGDFILTGSERMCQRPIKPLVNALLELGADIQYLKQDGFPPLKIQGRKLMGGTVAINAGISSQFITALMLIGPYLKSGLTIKLTGNKVSFPYLKMTASLMALSGISVEWKNNEIVIPEVNYSKSSITVEKDWSSIAFWYELVAIGKLPYLLVKDVPQESIQGDAKVSELFLRIGVESQFDEKGLHLRFLESLIPTTKLEFDLTDTPDLSQPLIVAMAALGVEAKICGLSTLKNKETNRGEALRTELAKFGLLITLTDDIIELPGTEMKISKEAIETYQDHRMAMAFASLAVKFGQIEIENPSVVEKSYPDYWLQFQHMGFLIKQ